MRSVSVFILFLFSIFLLTFCTFQGYAQISSPTADYSGVLNYDPDTVKYPDSPRTDPFFVFHTTVPGSPVTGTLLALPPKGTPGFDFTWSRYDPLSNSFDPPFFTETDLASSRVDDLLGGCYQVHISSADLDTIFRAWVFPNDPHVEVEKDSDGKIMPYGYTCDYLILEVVSAEADTMPYYDLSSGQALFLPNGMAFEWTSDDPDYEIFGAKRSKLWIYNQPPYSRPPTKDTRFTLTAVDSFGLSRYDDVLYESVHVKAEFSMMIEDEENPGDWTEEASPTGESPLEVKFINASENGVEFHWTLVDSAKTGEDPKIITEDINDSVVYTYYIPGYYFPSMVAYSEAGCVDSFPLVTRSQIQVEPSELDVSNVFTPNGDGTNDFFVVRGKSLKAFRITIFDRSGRKIYEYEHSDGRFEWEGWDGTIHGEGNRYAAPGVYYYIVDALGWDATVYRDIKPYTGFVYLFREAE